MKTATATATTTLRMKYLLLSCKVAVPANKITATNKQTTRVPTTVNPNQGCMQCTFNANHYAILFY